jgi:hypothetical protein
MIITIINNFGSLKIIKKATSIIIDAALVLRVSR